MFKILAEEYVNIFTALNLFNYITFRTGAAILTSLFFSLIFGKFIIQSLSNIQPLGQPIRDDGPKEHIISKAGTPTMGGVLIILSIIVSLLLWADLNNNFMDDQVQFIHIEIYDNPDEMKASGDISIGIQSSQISEWGIKTEPWTFLIENNGTIVERYEGFVSLEELREDINNLLNWNYKSSRKIFIES